MSLATQKVNNRIILGLMTFGPDESAGARITDQGIFKKALDTFQARGYNEVDTAPVYIGGRQEAFTREAGWKGRGLTLATKVKYPSEPGANAKDKVIASVESSLKELGTDCIDMGRGMDEQLLYLHRADRTVPFAETLEAMNELHKAGKFVQFGISNFTAYEVAEIVMTCKYNNWVRPTIYQGMYNCITRGIEAELFVACRRYGLDIVAYNPLAGGLFSGKIKSADLVPESGRFSNTTTTQGKNYRDRYFRESTFKALQLVEQATQKEGLTMIETALRWMVHHSQLKIKDGNDGIIIGVSSVTQLEDNLNNLEKGPLPDEVVQALDQAWLVSKVDSTNYWHGDLTYTYDTRKALFGSE
ncbi:aflatoxin B1 aldehyde reductase [Geosmithia morbida]|uniref:Aflatoxin B1 aldehyde reductase n=1 Tax=Geosmithia morbida TaxID=1094350 RepID=A0A9P5D2W6_9HYPO|nr:aflatoxin B1 aldehyde reductase [Geosmithia morbida]KAF4124307.1 aflatoxin B1 aldehyde reductase [Geosmithia morbida]